MPSDRTSVYFSALLMSKVYVQLREGEVYTCGGQLGVKSLVHIVI